MYHKDAVIASAFWLTVPEWFWPTLWAALRKQQLQYPQLSAEVEPWALLRNLPEFSQGLHHEHWQQQLFVQTTVKRAFLGRHTVAPAARARAVPVVQSLSRGWLSATSWTAGCHASLSFTISWSLLKLMSIELAMPSNHLVLCCPLLFLPSIFPSM